MSRFALASKPETKTKPGSVRRAPERTPPKATFVAPRQLPEAPEPAEPLQAKLTIGEVDDPLEHEADRVADHVMKMPSPASPPGDPSPGASGSGAAVPSGLVQRECSSCAEESAQKEGLESEDTLDEEASPTTSATVQRACESCTAKSSDEERVQRDSSPAMRARRMRSTPSGRFVRELEAARATGGRALPRAVRAFMEPRFGLDLGHVRVHTDQRAGDLNRRVGARAFTVGRDIFFRPSEFNPGTHAGRRLIAHELTHTVQQQRGLRSVQRELLQREVIQRDEAPGGVSARLAKAAVNIDERGLHFAPMGPVVFEEGARLPQVLAFALRNLVGSGYTEGLEDEALEAVPSLQVTVSLEGEAQEGERVRPLTIRAGSAEALMDWLTATKRLTLLVSDDDRDVLRFSNESVSLLVQLVEQGRFQLPAWMSNDLFRELLVRRTPLPLMRQFLDASRRYQDQRNSETAGEVVRLFRQAVEPLDLDTSVANALSLDRALSDLPDYVRLFDTLTDKSGLSDFFLFLEQEHPGDDPLKIAALRDSAAREELLARFGRFSRGESLEDAGREGTGDGAGAGTGTGDGAGAGTGPGTGEGLGEQWLGSDGLKRILDGKGPPLRRGKKGDDVRLAQRVLRRWGEKGATPPRDLLPKNGADGDFGSETEEAVREFQRENGLDPDGVIGRNTLGVLDEFALADGEVGREGIIVLPPIPARLLTFPSVAGPLFAFSLGAELRAQMSLQFADVFDAFARFDFAWSRVFVPSSAGATDAATAPGETPSSSEVARRRFERQVKNAKADIKTVMDQLGPAAINAGGLLAAKEILGFIGTGISLGIDELTRPSSEKSIVFPAPGLFLVRCVARQIPPEGAKFTHAASVAYIPVFVHRPEDIVAERVQSVDALLQRIRELEASLELDPANRSAIEAELLDLKLRLGDPQAQLTEIKKLIALASTDAERRVLEERKRYFEQLLELQRDRAAGRELFDTERLAATFVNDDGQEFVLNLQASRLRSDAGTVRYWLNDLTTPNSSQEEGSAPATGNVKADKASAILAATRAILSGTSGYGRGTVAVVIDGKQHTLRIEASLGTIVLEGIEAATTIASIAAVAAAPFTGGASLVLMLPIGAVGAIPSGYRLVHRGIDGTLRLDLQTAMDVANLVGAVAGLGQPAAASLRMVRLSNAFMFIGLGADGAGILLMQADLVNQLASVEGSPGQKRAQVLKILGGAMLNAGISVGTALGRRGEVEARSAETEGRIKGDLEEDPSRPRAEEPLGPRRPGETDERAAGGDVPGEILSRESFTLTETGAHSAVATRVGSAFEIWTCTHCTRLLDRVDEAISQVSPSGPSKTVHTRLTTMRARLVDIERRLSTKKLSLTNLPAELNQVGAHLRDLSLKFPEIEGLLGFRKLPISAELSTFLRTTAVPGVHTPASTYTGGKHVKGKTNAERQNASTTRDGQFLAERPDGTRVTDATITEWERLGIQRAREGHGRIEFRGAGGYHMYVDLGFVIGYAKGESTTVIRVEWASGRAVHSHPREPSDL